MRETGRRRQRRLCRVERVFAPRFGVRMPPFEQVRAWMFESALPFWAERGVDHARGGFYEELDLAGAPTDVSFKRTRVVCRQIYAFSHAALLGWEPGRALSAYGYDYLIDKCWLGPEDGWASRLLADGRVSDPTPDLYDLAFVLFALSWRFRASGDREALIYAHKTLDFIDAHMRPEEGPGFLHARPPTGYRDQNPHMHLTEACLAAYEASGEQRFLDTAREIIGVFRRHFFDGRTLAELFTADLSARAPGANDRIEPGHQFEWAWILAQYQRLARDDLSHEVRTLVTFAEAHGVDPATGLTYMQVTDAGAPTDRASRTWPNNERIKGHLALFELGGHDPVPAIESACAALFRYFLNVTPRGSWIDVFDAAGIPKSQVVPASTLYHVFLAFAELLRLEPKLRGA